MTPRHDRRRRSDRQDRAANAGFLVALIVGFQYATVESLTHAGVHFGACLESHAHTFPWMTALTIVVFAAPKTIGPERVSAILLALADRAKRITGTQKAINEATEPESAESTPSETPKSGE